MPEMGIEDVPYGSNRNRHWHNYMYKWQVYVWNDAIIIENIYIQNTYVRMVYHWGIVDTDFRRLRVRVSICVKKTSPKSYGIVGTIGVYIYLVYIDDVGQAFHKLWHQEKNKV